MFHTANRQNNSHSLHCYTFALFFYLCSFCVHFFSALCSTVYGLRHEKLFLFFLSMNEARNFTHSSVVCASTGASLHCPRCRRCTTTIICIHFFAHPPSTKMFFFSACHSRCRHYSVVRVARDSEQCHDEYLQRWHRPNRRPSPVTADIHQKWKESRKQTNNSCSTMNSSKRNFQRKWKPQRRESESTANSMEHDYLFHIREWRFHRRAEYRCGTNWI